jgi:hypothetical protein
MQISSFFSNSLLAAIKVEIFIFMAYIFIFFCRLNFFRVFQKYQRKNSAFSYTHNYKKNDEFK